ncbi:hypothetical protein SAMN04488134_101160 [Amphibacillus marinus]|uniref:S1 motif domain-containing protein n=1 Tax=Amphibacillus marinus TaxID=872970 RepID=A0A1H8GSD7_9BACI|nr:S1-like domain-containing RNA-binding protein [Amphibacillus marinus]SEN47031.1 hypothetical protein SAMN04488134_101160 [Amphibacillus marinus]
MTAIRPGETVQLIVKRVIETGYVLTEETSTTTEILLHQNETTETLNENDKVNVFLYHNKNKQLIATMNLPRINYDVFDWAEVTEVNAPLGVFVNIGTSKHILVSADDLPVISAVWPQPGDQLYVTLKQDKKGRLLADPIREEDFEGNWDQAPETLFNQDISGRVFRSGKEGAVVITDQGYRGFIHSSERKKDLRLGEWIDGRVIKVKHDGSLNLSLLSRKQDAQAEDAYIILQYLQKHNGIVALDNKSDPEEIAIHFNMSKAAFKRAIGKLYKERLIVQENGKTILINDKN